MLFFFFKQKTAYGMRISDWSSDVCSSDLLSRSALARSHDFDAMSDLAKALRDKLRGCAHVQALPVITEHVSADGTVKRSEDRSVGKEHGGTCRSRCAPYH